jgi:hypothetical protein
MNWELYSKELKKQLKTTEISKRKLSLKIGRDGSYISQIFAGKIKKVDYETSRILFEELNLIDNKLLDYYLYLLDVILPREMLDSTIESNMLKGNMTLEQCYKGAWGHNPGILDDNSKAIVSQNKEGLFVNLSEEVLEKLNKLSEEEFRTAEQQARKILTDYFKEL